MHRRQFIQRAGILAAGAVAPRAVWARQSPRVADVVIRGGSIHRGRGDTPVIGDVAIVGQRIAAAGDIAGWSTRRTIDATGKHVAPGFIDPHSHAGESLRRRALHKAEPLLAQGVTTIVANPDGGGPLDVAKQRQGMKTLGAGVNVVQLIGHGVVRSAVLQMEDRSPTAAELERMRTHVRAALRDGAFGLSSGLFYAPGSYARTEEVIALMRVVADAHGPAGFHTSHIRDEGNYSVGVQAAVEEIIAIAEASTTTGIVSHMKALGPDNWGKVRDCATIVEAARARGVRMFADQYPYEASSTSLAAAVLPRSAQVGGAAALRARLAAPVTRAAMRPDVRENIRRRGGAASLVVAFYPPERAIEGMSLEAISAARKMAPEDAALALIAAGDVSIVSFNMSMDDIEFLMRQPWMMTCSDGAIFLQDEGRPHPRGHGAFTRKLTTFVEGRHTLGLEAAVRSMTGLPAEVLSLEGRGTIEEDAFADIVVFDPAALRDNATYEAPHRLATGMSYVLVNGAVAVDDGRFVGGVAGHFLRREARP